MRDYADMTGFLAAQAKFHLSPGGTIDLNPDHGTIRVIFKPQGVVPADDLAIAVAQCLAYELSIGTKLRRGSIWAASSRSG